MRGPETLGNTADDSAGLPSTVPESHHIFDGSVLALPPEAPTTNPSRKMNSQTALEATQELSPNYWELHISRTRSAVSGANHETQHTLNEGDDGFIDITSSLVQQEADDEEEVDETRDFSPSQSQRRLPQFPESQRFKTPATAGKKRDYNGNTRDSPELPRAPILRSGGPTPAHLMGLTQAFDATQAATSPFVNGAINPLSDRPSPNLEVDNRPATATASSPLLRPISEFRRATTEPATRYVSVRQSQEERQRRAQLELLDQDDDESEDDGFSEEPSLVKALRRRRENDARAREQFRLVSSPSKARPRGSSDVKSSPVLAARRTSPSPPSGLHLSDTGMVHVQVPEPDDEDIEPSEAETEQEEEVDVEIRRSSQTSPMDDEDKENYDGHMQVPETTAGFRRLVDTLPSQVEASPSLRHGTAATRASTRPVASSGPVAVANSQPSQPASKSQTSRQNPKSSSTSGIDFVPQSQANTGLQAASAPAAQTPPPSPKAITAQELGSANILEDQGVAKDEQEAGVGASIPDQSSAPAQLGSMVPETDSPRVAQSHQPSRSTNSAPQANSLNTSMFETAATRLPPASNRTTKLSEMSSPPIVTTPPGRKRKRMSEISAEPSPQQQSTQGFDPMEALHMGSDVQAFLDESPIRPRARPAKKAKILESEVEMNETIENACRRLTRVTQSKTMIPDQANDEPQEEAEKQAPSLAHPTLEPPNLRASTRSRASVWELDASPPQKRVPTRGMDKQAPSPAALAQKGKAPSSTAPAKKHPQQKDQAPTRAQTQASTSVNDLTQAIPIVSKPPPGEVIAPNAIFACFNGRTRGYYPARCLGSINGEVPRYRVQWQGFEPDEVDAFGVRSLDLRVGDQVKIDMKEKGFPRVSHIVHGFKDKAGSGDVEQLTDIRGYMTVLVAPKQRKSLPADVSTETVSEVPVSAIYLDSNMWNQMKERSYEFKPPPEASISVPGYATPLERASTPSTPSSRNRRYTAVQPVVEIPPSSGLFANMAFAISYEDDSRKTALVTLIRENGGRLLRESFMELLEPDTVAIRPHFANIGFTALIADKHSRKEKYMQALALGLPCVSGKWLEACSEKESLVDWHSYLLAAGESEELEGATKSRIMERMDPARMRLAHILQSRPILLEAAKVIIVMGRGKSEAKRKPYLFLIQALGAQTFEKVSDIRAAKDLLKGDDRLDWVFVEDNNVEAAKAELLGTAKTKGAGSCKVAGNELVVQSLIMGKLCEC